MCLSFPTPIVHRILRMRADDGYRLTYGGLDYLALHAHTRTSSIIQMGSTMGVGKESDILLVTSPPPPSVNALQDTPLSLPVQSILKIHRLGRTSFRTASNNRSYKGDRHAHCSWQHLSQLSARKEYAAMCVLREAGFHVPEPIAQNRHTVVMSLVPGMPLRQIPLIAFGRSKQEQEKAVAALYAELLEIVLRLADRGLIHGDMNEFNVLIEGVPEEYGNKDQDCIEREDEKSTIYEQERETTFDSPGTAVESLEPPNVSNETENLVAEFTPHIIDFPQITSMSHPQADEFFERDVRGIENYFRKRYHFESEEPAPCFKEAQARLEGALRRGMKRLDVEVQAAGFDRKAAKELEAYYAEQSREADADRERGIADEGSWAMSQRTGVWTGPDPLDKTQKRDDAEESGGTSEIPDDITTVETVSGVTQTKEVKSADLYQSLNDLTVSAETVGSQTLHQSDSKAATGWSI